jgi:putative ABC transport system substrate-binding protein
MTRIGALLRLAAAGALLFAGATPAPAQQPGGVPRIGYIIQVAGASADLAFRAGLREAGYAEGRNIVVETRTTEGRIERVPEIVAELLRARVDLLVVTSAAPALAAKRMTSSVPIVFVSVVDPVAAGLVESLARPGGNLTGTALLVGGAGFGGKWLELLREAVPGVDHVAALRNPDNPAVAPVARGRQQAAATLGVRLDVVDAGDVAALDRAFDAMRASGARAFVVTPDPFFTLNRDRIVARAAKLRLPGIGFSRLLVDAGGLLSYGANVDESFRRAARYVDRILKGAKPADLPVEQPTTFELVVNRRTAAALGLAIPQSLLLRADEIVE